MANRDLVVIGGSTGAVPALTAILHALPANLPAAIVVILRQWPVTTKIPDRR